MPPLFMVNPPDAYSPDTALAPYGLPPNNALSAPPPASIAPTPVTGGHPPLALIAVLSPGTALKNGRYRIIQRFSGGSAGADTELPLMVATDTELPNERVLIQELPLAGMHPEDGEYIRHGIIDRLDALSQMSGIAHLRDSFVEQRRSFLVFELPSGDRLLDRLRRAHGPLPETTVIGIVLQILDILSALERGPVPIIHGNISPANILLRPGGQVVLVGFSPTLLIYPTGQVTSGPAGALSAYSAPEQARGTADVRSDLFATCAVMHYAVTGSEPVGRMFPLARHANPSISLELEDILGQGLRPSPSQRYQSPEALREVLAPLASGKRLTHVHEALDAESPTGLRLARDAQGRLIGPRQRLTQNPLFFVAIVLMLVALLGGGVLYALQPHASAPSNTPQTITSAFASYYQSKGIGLSGGEFVFDTQQPDYALKQAGALALGSGDVNGALTAYQKAVTSQPNDVEALIYAADLQILKDKAPYVTIIAGVAFGANDDAGSADSADFDAARYELQGVYLAQQRFNQSSTSSGHVRLRVLVLNSGKDPSDAQLASTLMLNQIHTGNVQNIVGIIGWPESNQSRLAMAALGASGLPLISPLASANNLEDTAGNFYSLVPSDSQQAGDLADAAVNSLKAHRILVVYDPSDQENSDVATNFSNRVVLNYSGMTTIVGRVAYDSTSFQNASAFQQVAAAALAQNADLIYLVGDQEASIFLANAVAQQAVQTLRVAPHILVGSQILMSPYFGVGNDPGAMAARANPNPLGLIYVATLASVDHWQMLNLAPPDVRAFSDGFSTLFKGFWGAGGLALPGSLAILSYDATNLLLVALTKDLQMAHNDVVIPSVEQITVALRQFTDRQPFVGLGGAVGFSNSIHQPNKALGIYTLLPIPNASINSPVVQLQLLTVVGGKTVFCGHSDCTPY
jgi:ABC-type branched-subunit amino acid transport system substrate-binding protein/serine/threonine protein kinase